MKDIKDMNLEEVRQKIYEHALAINNDELYSLLDRLDELTRWNNIDDLLPPKGALFETCGVESGTYWRHYTPPPSPAVDALYPPEGV
jgi:hypothetical protein